MQSSARTASARARRCFGLVSCVTALSCGGQTDSGAASASVQGGNSDSGGGGSTISLGPGGRTGSGGHTGAGGTLIVGAGGGAAVDAGALVPVAVDAGPEPVVSCGPTSDASGDALDGAACAPPPSHCVDQHTLAYYTGGRCVDGLCSWTTQVLTCPTACYGEGCRNNVTLH